MIARLALTMTARVYYAGAQSEVLLLLLRFVCTFFLSLSIAFVHCSCVNYTVCAHTVHVAIRYTAATTQLHVLHMEYAFSALSYSTEYAVRPCSCFILFFSIFRRLKRFRMTAFPLHFIQ